MAFLIEIIWILYHPFSCTHSLGRLLQSLEKEKMSLLGDIYLICKVTVREITTIEMKNSRIFVHFFCETGSYTVPLFVLRSNSTVSANRHVIEKWNSIANHSFTVRLSFPCLLHFLMIEPIKYLMIIVLNSIHVCIRTSD